ncbi:MAG: UvrD-helicase domain-containing protein, partial [Clostridiaceae bacterium]|nr:UvrD-helicase domain-containing protein [Clostridiaceae bacterium]
MQNLLDKLNPSQQKAVTHTQGPLLVLAGAGSGKTRVLTYRVAYLIKECGVPPYMILAITFTNKAANEMKERLVQILGDDGERVWARTFHSACVRILRQEIDAIGYGRNFNILDAADAERLVKECVSELNLDEKAFAPKIVIPVISDAKDNMLSPGDFLKRFGNDYRYKNIGRIYELYQKKLKIQNALDFDDLITLTVKLFEENPSILEKYQNRFRYILVDEYQDTNNSQYRLIKLLSQKYQN